jgi:uncharacterized surface anchored protein
MHKRPLGLRSPNRYTPKNRSVLQRLTATAVSLGVAASGLLMIPSARAVTVAPFSAADGFDGDIYGDYILLGNTVVRCPTAAEVASYAAYSANDAAVCNTGLNSNSGAAAGTEVNDNFTMQHADVDGVASTFNSSTATITIPAGAKVAKARLIWGGHTGFNYKDPATFGSNVPIVSCQSSRPSAGAPLVAGKPTGPDAAATAAAQSVKFTVDGTTNVLAPQIYHETPLANVIYSAGRQYAASADVTSIMAAIPTGAPVTMTGANIWTPEGYNCYAGWTLVVVYKYDAPNALAPELKHVSVFYGYADIQAADPVATTTQLSGFVMKSGVKRVGAVAWEGDQGITGDTLSVKGTTGTVTSLTEPRTGLTTNFMSSTADGHLNPATNNTFGTDAKSVTLPAGAINVGDTTIDLSFDTAGDRYGASLFAFSGPVVGATLTGNVFVDTNIDGTKAAGETTPVTGTVVTLKNSTGGVVGTTTVDGTGNFSFPNLPGDTYTVSYDPPGNYVPTSTPTQATVVLPQGGTAAVNVGAALPSVSGTVRSQPSGNGLSPVAIDLVNSSGTTVASTTTAADGTYSFLGIADGVYTIRETQPSTHLDAFTNPVVPGSGGGTAGLNEITGVTVASTGTASGNDFNEIQPSSLSGTVRNATTNAPISGVTVTLTGTDDKGASITLTTPTLADGTYSFAGLRPGTYVVTESQPAGFVDAATNPVVLGNSGGTLGTNKVTAVTLTSGTVATGYDFNEIKTGTIAGSVTNKTNNTPIGGVTITLTGTDDLGAPVSATTQTLPDGTYVFSGVRPGTYAVAETQPANYFDTATNPVVLGSTGGTAGTNAVTAITLPAGGASTGNNFNEIAPSSMSGVVKNATTNTPIGGVIVTLKGTDDKGNAVDTFTTTAPDGTYSFNNLRPGTYSLTETQPIAYLDAFTNPVVAGSTNGTVGSNAITAITLPAGTASTGNNFNEIEPSSIAGKVTNSVTGAPLTGVTVTLTGTDDSGNPVTKTAQTGPDGTYAFTGLRPGTYSVTETQPSGYVDPVGGGVSPGSIGGVAATNAINTIVLTGGNTSADNNFAELPAGSINGSVYTDANNDGSNAGDLPIGGAVVNLSGTNDLGITVVAQATTAPDGTYSFPNLRPGSYSVTEVQPVGTLDGKDTAGSLNGTVTPDKISAIPLASGENGTGYNFGELKPATISGTAYADLDQSGALSGADLKLGGVTVKLTGTDDLGNPVDLTAVTAADGTYSFTGVRPGTYVLTETQPANYVDGPATPGSLGGTPTPNKISAIIVASGDNSTGNNFGEKPTADVAIAKSVTVAGPYGLGQTITYRVTVSNSGPNAATDVVVHDAWPAGITFLSAVTASGTYDGTAHDWTIPTLASGATAFVDITARLDSVTPGMNTANIVSTTSADPTLGDHQATADIASSKPATISGRVYVDKNNDGSATGEAGIAGTAVSISGTDDLGNLITSTVFTDANGDYTFPGLRPGNYSVTEAQPAAYFDGKDTAGSTAGSNATTNDKVSAIALTPGLGSTANNFGELAPATVSGSVTNAAGGAPIAGVAVVLTGTDDLGAPVTMTTNTLADGTYSFGNLRPGTYTVTETQPTGWYNPANGGVTPGSTGGTASADKISTVTVASGDTSTANNFTEIAPSSVGGSVKDTSGAPIAGVTVTITGTNDLGQPVSFTTSTKDDGTYKFSDLRPGTYAITETQPLNWFDPKDGGVAPGTTGGTAGPNKINAITLASNQNSTSNDFVELKPSIVSGVVTNQTTGAPIAGVTITLVGVDDQGAPVSTTTQTKADGTYNFPDLRPGTYTLTETQPADLFDPAINGVTPGTAGGTVGPNTIKDLTVEPGKDATANNFAEIAPSSLSGSVKEAGTGAPIAGVIVTLTGTDDLGNPVSKTTETLADGTYSFTGLRPGNYVITETQPGTWFDPKDGGVSPGTSGGTPEANKLSAINLPAGTNATANDFTEIAPSSIAGKVTNHVTGAPIAGVTVALTGTDDRGNPVTATTAQTAPNGTYLFPGLRPGTYTVTETQPNGTVDAATGAVTPGTTRGTVAPNELGAITLAPHTDSTGNDFTDMAPSAISGLVFDDVNNDGIQDANEKGIGAATIRLTGTDDLGAPVALTTTTNPDGTWSITGLRPGTYSVNEVQPSGYLDGVDTLGTRATLSANDVSAVVLGNEETSVDNINAEIQPSTVSGFVYADTNIGGGKDTSELGLPGVQVTLTGTDDRGQTITLTTLTGLDGSYSFPALRPGTYRIHQVQPNGVFDGADQPGTNGATADGNDSFSVTLTPGSTSKDNNFGEQPPASISGSVEVQSNPNGGAGSPIANVVITLTGTDFAGNAVTRTTTTAADGTWTFADLAPGTYKVTEAQPAAYNDGSLVVGSAGGTSEPNVFNVKLSSGAKAVGYRFLEILPPVVQTLDYPQIVEAAPEPAPTTTPPTTQPPAPVTVPVTAAPVAVAPVTTVAPVTPSVPAPVKAKPASITGTVFLDKNKNKAQDPKDPGLSGVQILLTDPLGVTTTVNTNENGTYNFDNLEAGAYVVTVVSKKAPNDGPKIRKINVESASVSSQNFSFISSSDVLGVQENGASELAFTGSNSMTMFLTAIGFAGLGTALTALGRRRRKKA